jgi:O-antigen ligase
LVTITATRAWGFLLGLGATAAITLCQILTRSRAGWLAFAAALVVWLAAVVVSVPVRRDPTIRFRMIATVLAIGFGIVLAVLLPNTLRWRSENPYLESMRGVANFQEGSGHGRLIQYRRTLELAAQNPVLGAGPGNWAVEYPRFAAPRDPSLSNSEGGTTSNPWPSSDWVAFIAEHGLVATVLLLVVFAGIALRATQRLLTAWTPREALAGVAALSTVIATLVAGMFDAVLLLAPPTLLVWAVLGALWTPAERRLNITPRLQGALLLSLVVLSGIGAVRSSGQLGAIGIYATQRGTGWLSFASGLDPGNYRLHVQLARSSNSRAKRCRHAHAAHELYPSAAEGRSLDRRCPRK